MSRSVAVTPPKWTTYKDVAEFRKFEQAGSKDSFTGQVKRLERLFKPYMTTYYSEASLFPSNNNIEPAFLGPVSHTREWIREFVMLSEKFRAFRNANQLRQRLREIKSPAAVWGDLLLASPVMVLNYLRQKKEHPKSSIPTPQAALASFVIPSKASNDRASGDDTLFGQKEVVGTAKPNIFISSRLQSKITGQSSVSTPTGTRVTFSTNEPTRRQPENDDSIMNYMNELSETVRRVRDNCASKELGQSLMDKIDQQAIQIAKLSETVSKALGNKASTTASSRVVCNGDSCVLVRADTQVDTDEELTGSVLEQDEESFSFGADDDAFVDDSNDLPYIRTSFTYQPARFELVKVKPGKDSLFDAVAQGLKRVNNKSRKTIVTVRRMSSEWMAIKKNQNLKINGIKFSAIDGDYKMLNAIAQALQIEIMLAFATGSQSVQQIKPESSETTIWLLSRTGKKQNHYDLLVPLTNKATTDNTSKVVAPAQQTAKKKVTKTPSIDSDESSMTCDSSIVLSIDEEEKKPRVSKPSAKKQAAKKTPAKKANKPPATDSSDDGSTCNSSIILSLDEPKKPAAKKSAAKKAPAQTAAKTPAVAKQPNKIVSASQPSALGDFVTPIVIHQPSVVAPNNPSNPITNVMGDFTRPASTANAMGDFTVRPARSNPAVNAMGDFTIRPARSNPAVNAMGDFTIRPARSNPAANALGDFTRPASNSSAANAMGDFTTRPTRSQPVSNVMGDFTTKAASSSSKVVAQTPTPQVQEEEEASMEDFEFDSEDDEDEQPSPQSTPAVSQSPLEDDDESDEEFEDEEISDDEDDEEEEDEDDEEETPSHTVSRPDSDPPLTAQPVAVPSSNVDDEEEDSDEEEDDSDDEEEDNDSDDEEDYGRYDDSEKGDNNDDDDDDDDEDDDDFDPRKASLAVVETTSKKKPSNEKTKADIPEQLRHKAKRKDLDFLTPKPPTELPLTNRKRIGLGWLLETLPTKGSYFNLHESNEYLITEMGYRAPRGKGRPTMTETSAVWQKLNQDQQLTRDQRETLDFSLSQRAKAVLQSKSLDKANDRLTRRLESLPPVAAATTANVVMKYLFEEIAYKAGFTFHDVQTLEWEEMVSGLDFNPEVMSTVCMRNADLEKVSDPWLVKEDVDFLTRKDQMRSHPDKSYYAIVKDKKVVALCIVQNTKSEDREGFEALELIERGAALQDPVSKNLVGRNTETNFTNCLGIKVLCASTPSYVNIKDKLQLVKKMYKTVNDQVVVMYGQGNKAVELTVHKSKILDGKGNQKKDRSLKYGKLLVLYSLFMQKKKQFEYTAVVPDTLYSKSGQQLDESITRDSELMAYFHLNFGYQRVIPLSKMSLTPSSLWFIGYKDGKPAKEYPSPQALDSTEFNTLLWHIKPSAMKNYEKRTDKPLYPMIRPYPTWYELFLMLSDFLPK